MAITEKNLIRDQFFPHHKFFKGADKLRSTIANMKYLIVGGISFGALDLETFAIKMDDDDDRCTSAWLCTNHKTTINEKKRKKMLDEVLAEPQR